MSPDLIEVVDRTFFIDTLKRLEDVLGSVRDEISTLLTDIEPLVRETGLPQAHREAYAVMLELLHPLDEEADHALSACRESDALRKPSAGIGEPDPNHSVNLATIARHHIDGINSAEANLLEKVEEAHAALQARHPDGFFDWEGFPSGYNLSLVLDPGEARRCYANRDDGLLQLRVLEYSPFLTPGDDQEFFTPGEGHPLHGCRMGRLVHSMVGTSPIHYRSVGEHSPLPWQILPLLHKIEDQVLSTTDKTLWVHGFGDVTTPIELSCGCTFDGKMFHMGRMPAD
jgi:hypothetical protein